VADQSLSEVLPELSKWKMRAHSQCFNPIFRDARGTLRA
jgi:hypothetical protein